MLIAYVETPLKYDIKDVHITTIKPGDTIEYDGELKTVCRNNIKTGGFHGTTLFGDSYNGGRVSVKKVTIFRAMPLTC